MQSLQQQKPFHSFVLCRINKIDFAQKCNNIVFTKDNQIVKIDSTSKDISENMNQYVFNITIDAVKYQHGPIKIILAELQSIKSLIKVQLRQILTSQIIIIANAVFIDTQLKFYLYLGRKIFVEIHPHAICSNTLYFIINDDDYNHNFQEESFKSLADVVKYTKNQLTSEHQIFHFNSEFSLLSDEHFLNNFIRGYRQMSSYIKNSGQFTHIIDDKIWKTICQLFPTAKL